jgi:hypothetical protein
LGDINYFVPLCTVCNIYNNKLFEKKKLKNGGGKKRLKGRGGKKRGGEKVERGEGRELVSECIPVIHFVVVGLPRVGEQVTAWHRNALVNSEQRGQYQFALGRVKRPVHEHVWAPDKQVQSKLAGKNKVDIGAEHTGIQECVVLCHDIL